MEKPSILKQEALGIINELDLLDFLGTLGESWIVGSVALDLIVKPDIDIHLLIEHDNLLKTADQISHYLINQPKIKEIRITDWREEGGIKLGVDVYPGSSETWSIDVWITSRAETTGFKLVDELKDRLKPEHRYAIMEIKRHYYQQGKLRDGMSMKIYRAVLDKNVRTVEDFEKYQNIKK